VGGWVGWEVRKEEGGGREAMEITDLKTEQRS
jgi:hypothetical protein